jgi:ubiquinone/menaquinone biosynthesis C-methylase UbiE
VVQRAAAVRTGERILDLACGTGELLRRIAAEIPEADPTGVDLAPGMIDRARRKLAGVPHAQVQQADAHDLPFDESSFDAAVCANSFHYFSHPQQVLAEARRVLRSDGRLVLLDWCRDYWTCKGMDAVLQRVDPAYDTCYTIDELTTLLERAGLRTQYMFRYRFDLVWGMMVATAIPAAS